MNIAERKNGSNKSRTYNTVRNIIAGIGTKLINILVPFLVRTIMIRKMGAEYVGLTSLFTSILQVLSVSELGFSSAVIFSMYKPVADNDTNKIQQLLTMYRSIYRVVGYIIMGAGVAVCPFLKLLIHGSYPNEINLYILYLIYLTNTFLSYFAFGYKNVILEVNQRRDILSKIESLVGIVRGTIQIFVLIFTRNFYLYALALPILTFVSNLLVDYFTRKMYPSFKCSTRFSLKGIDEIKDQLKGVALGKISVVSTNAFDSIILSALLGLNISAIYSNYYYVFTAVVSAQTLLLQAMSASIGNSLVTENKEKNYADHLKFDFYYEFIVGICTICLYCLYQQFMKLWAGETMMFPTSTMILFCIYYYSINLGQIRALYSQAAGLWWEIRYYSIFAMISNLALNFILGYIWGANGIVFASIFSSFVVSYILVSKYVITHLFQRSSLHYFSNNIFYAISTIIGCILIRNVTNDIEVGNIGMLFVKAIIVGLLSVLFLGLIYIAKRDTRAYLKAIIYKIMKKEL